MGRRAVWRGAARRRLTRGAGAGQADRQQAAQQGAKALQKQKLIISSIVVEPSARAGTAAQVCAPRPTPYTGIHRLRLAGA
jgi:hypothetical protein